MTEINTLFSCNSKELTFLCSLVGANGIFGIDHPLTGLSEEDIKKEWGSVSDSLLKKRFIAKNPDGSITLDQTVSAVLTTCCFCDIYIMTNHTSKPDKSEVNHYYVTSYLAVLMTVKPDDEHLCTFSVFENAGEVHSKIQNDLMVDGNGYIVGTGGTIKESSLSEVKMLLKDNDTHNALSLLKGSGFNADDAHKLVNSLLSPQFSKVILVLKFKDDSKGNASGFTLLNGEGGFWKLTSEITSDGNMVNIIPCNSEQLKNDVLSEISEIFNILKQDNEL